MGVLKLKLTSARDAATLTSTFETAGGNHAIAQRILNFVNSLQTGTEGAQGAGAPPSIAISIQDNQVQATGSVIFSGAATANDTVLLNGVTFTAVASGATGNQFNTGSTLTQSAANLAATINASVTALIAGYVTAVIPVAGTVRVISAFYGISGNQTTIAKGVDGGGVMTVSGARLTTGADDPTAQTLNF